MPTIAFVTDPQDALMAERPVRWGLERLHRTLGERGVGVVELSIGADSEGQDLTVHLGSADERSMRRRLEPRDIVIPRDPESFALVPTQPGELLGLMVAARDARGLGHALTELADRARYAEDPVGALTLDAPAIERPANRVRSVMRLFASDVEDLSWFHDDDFWPAYLDFIAAQRWNRFHLALGLSYDFPRRVRDSYFYFAYPFLLDVPGFRVRATGLAPDEPARNLAQLRRISRMAAERGLHFQLGLWTHAYELFESPEANHTIQGLTPESHAAYCRAALTQLLHACPDIHGITFRIHGESGVAEGSYDFWQQVFAGVADAGRAVEIDLHAKGIEPALIDLALATRQRVTVSPKYWAEHMGPPYHQAGIRPLEQAGKPGSWEGGYMTLSTGSRRFTRYGYADLLREDRGYGIIYRVWPGTQRLLLWGDPAMAAGYGRFSSFCDADGMELFEPLSFKGRRGSGIEGPRGGYADESLRPPEGDWAKYKVTYRLFGRLLYNPAAPAEQWRRAQAEELGVEGDAAQAAEQALSHASRILPLVTVAHLPSAANNTFWPEVYTNQPIVDESRPHPYGDTPAPKVFGTVSPLDPVFFSTVEEFAEEVTSGRWSPRYSPLDVARWLDGKADLAAIGLLRAPFLPPRMVPTPTLQRLTCDVQILCALGHFFAEKLRASVAYALHQRGPARTALEEGIAAMERAVAAWRETAEAGSVYVQDLTFGPEPKLRGHWRDRLQAFEADLADLRAAYEALPADTPAGISLDSLNTRMEARPLAHTPPPGFTPGRPLALSIEGAGSPVHLHYRHVNQAEPWQVLPMDPTDSTDRTGGTYEASIPGEYTNSPFPLQYFFSIHRAERRPWLFPGLAPDLSNQAYFVVRPSPATQQQV